MLYDRIAVERHIYTATRAERIQNSKHWILAINAEERTQQSLNQRPDLVQAKRECKRFMTSTWQGPKKNTEPFLAVNNSEKDTNLRTTKNLTTWLTLKQVGGSTKGRRKTCRQIRQDRGPTCKQLRHRRQRGTKPIERLAIGILSILQALTTGDFFSELGQVRLLGEKISSQPTGV